MTPPITITNFGRFSAADTVAMARLVKSKLTGHPAFPEPYPSYVPSLQQLGNNTDLLESAVHAARNRDLEMIAQKNNCCVVVQKDLGTLAKHVELVAQGNESLIQAVGFAVRRKKAKSTVRTPPGAPLVEVKQGLLPGTLAVTVTRGCKAASIEVEITDGDPSVEQNWRRAGLSTICQFQVPGLQPGTKYTLRARCVGSAGPGPWSAYVTIYCN